MIAPRQRELENDHRLNAAFNLYWLCAASCGAPWPRSASSVSPAAGAKATLLSIWQNPTITLSVLTSGLSNVTSEPVATTFENPVFDCGTGVLDACPVAWEEMMTVPDCVFPNVAVTVSDVDDPDARP